MKPENEQLADSILALLKAKAMTPDEIEETLHVREEKRVAYILGQLVRKGRAVRLEQRRYGHPVRVSASAPPPSI